MVKKVMEQDMHVCHMYTLPLPFYPLPCRPISISTHRIPTNKVVHISQVFSTALGPYQGGRKDGRGNEPLHLRNVRCAEPPEDSLTWPMSDCSVACYSLTSFALLVHG